MTNIVAILIIFVMVGIVTSFGIEARPRVRVGTGVIRDGAHIGRQPVIIICRSERITPLMPRNEIGALDERLREPGDVADFPHFRAVMLAPDRIAFEPRPGDHGSTILGLDDPQAEFRRLLAQLDPRSHYLLYLVDGDSFDLFRKARLISQTAGFGSAWMPQTPSPAGPGIPEGTILFVPRGQIPEIQQ
ncbi:MAG: hypothetical protein AB7K09_24440 [Planctomycetota bacterium]